MDKKPKIIKGISYDAEYISYIDSGESAAVFVVRDIVNTVDSFGKWIHIVDIDTYKKENRIAFNYIIAELFDRKIKLDYLPKDSYSDIDYRNINKYITWQTAHEDINNQKMCNVIGPKYLILCNLYNKNKGKWVVEDALWNTTFKRWVPWKWKTPSCVVKERRRYIEPESADWQYAIEHVTKLTEKEVKFIKKNRNTILNKIEVARKPNLNYFFSVSPV